MKTIYSLVLLFLGVLLFNAQKKFQVQGTVRDFHDKTPIKEAQIQLGEYYTTTDSKGKFSFSKIPQGHYDILIKHPYCTDFQENIYVEKDLDLSVQLEHHVEEIEAITLHRSHKNNGSLVIKTLNQKDFDRNSTENLGNLLSNISGVSTLKTGNNIAKPIIHGLYGDRVTIMNNGVKLADQEWGTEHAPNVDANNFQHIDVVKGASALKYGSGAIGGVVLLEPEIFPKKDTLKGKASLSGISNGKGVDFNLNLAKIWKNGWAVKTNGSYKKFGDLKTPNYGLQNTGMEMNSFGFTLQNNSFNKGFSLDYYLTKQEIGIYRGSDLGNLNDFYTVFNSDNPIYHRDFSYKIENPKQEIEHHIAKISAFKRVEHLGKIALTYDLQYNHRKEFDIRRGNLYEIPALDLELYTNNFSLDNLIEREHWNLETGLDFTYQNNYSTTSTQAKRLVPNYNKYSWGAYSIFKYQFSNTLRSELGARFDQSIYKVKMWYDLDDWQDFYAEEFPQFYVETKDNRVFTKPDLRYNNWAFSAGLEYDASELFHLKLNYAKVSRTPNIAELFADGLHHSAGIIEKGDLRLKPEDGNQFNLVIDSQLEVLQGLHLSVNPYLFITKNFITEIPTGIQNTIRGVFPVWSYKQIDAKMYGVDFDADWKLTHQLKYDARFSYVHGQNESQHIPLILMMPIQLTNSLEFSKKEWKNFYFKLQNQYVFKQNRFPEYNFSIPIFENGVEVTKMLDFSTPPPAYSLWNIQAGLQINSRFSLGLNVTNLLNENYKNYLNRMRYFSYEMGRNIILTLKYNF